MDPIQESPGGSFPDYSTCLQVVPALLSGAQGSQPGLQPPAANPLKKVRGEKEQWLQTLLPCLVLPPSGASPLHPCSRQFLGM